MNKQVRYVNEDAKAEMQFLEMVFGGGNTLSFEGELIAKNPTVEEFASAYEEFARIVELGRPTDHVKNGVIYFDTGAGRPYWVEEEDVEIIELH